MSFSITHLMGDSERNPPLTAIPNLIEELRTADEEHTNVAVKHESGWCLSIFPDGYVVWENVEEEDGDVGPYHLNGLTNSEVLALASSVARGDLDPVKARRWATGYGASSF